MNYEQALALIGTKSADLVVTPIEVRETPRVVVNRFVGTEQGNFYESAILRRNEKIMFDF